MPPNSASNFGGVLVYMKDEGMLAAGSLVSHWPTVQLSLEYHEAAV